MLVSLVWEGFADICLLVSDQDVSAHGNEVILVSFGLFSFEVHPSAVLLCCKSLRITHLALRERSLRQVSRIEDGGLARLSR